MNMFVGDEILCLLKFRRKPSAFGAPDRGSPPHRHVVPSVVQRQRHPRSQPTIGDDAFATHLVSPQVLPLCYIRGFEDTASASLRYDYGASTHLYFLKLIPIPTAHLPSSLPLSPSRLLQFSYTDASGCGRQRKPHQELEGRSRYWRGSSSWWDFESYRGDWDHDTGNRRGSCYSFL